MKLFSLALVLIFPILLGGCASAAIITQEKSVAKNTEQVIGEFGYWRRDCSDQHFDLYIEKYPLGGDLRFEVGSLVIPDNPDVGSAGSCVGEHVKSKKVIYVAHPDFVGLDMVSIVLKSNFLLGYKSYDVLLDVQ